MVSLLTVRVILPQVGGVALGTHVIPVLSYPCPVQYIVGRNAFLLVDMKPALATLTGRAGVPANRKALVPAPGKFNEVLLQWSDSKNI
jgi:hypothetical protein